MKTETCYLGLGSNIGDRLKNLQNAVKLLEKNDLAPTCFSAIYETSYVGKHSPQPNYLNAAIGINCVPGECSGRLQPTKIVDCCLKIENELGRKKVNREDPRIIDIDLLLCGKIINKVEKAIVPHPRMHERLFVLTPLKEIAGNKINPVLNKTIEELYYDCLNKSEEKVKLFAPAYTLQNY